MRKIYIMLLILLGFSFLTSCQLDKDILLGNKEPHEHVLVPEWTQNEKYHWHACSGCDKIVEKEEHDFGSWVEVKEATEYEVGEEKRECICGFTETRKIEKLDHTHKPTGEYGHNDKYHWETCSECDAQLNKKSHTGGVATCQEKATCTICNVQYGSLSNKHVYGEYVVISEATCKERAIEEATCTVDGCQAKDTRYVPGSTTVGHKWGEWTYIEGSATCLKDGMEERGCLTCSSKEKRSAEGTKLAHHASSEVLFDGNSHWNSCDVTKGCTEKLNVVAHSYDNDCDEVCNGCAHERQGHHTFDNACDKVCNICEAERYTPDHTGGVATCLLPAICSECGVPYGLPLQHTYHNECDATCNMCGLVTRVPKPHKGGVATCEEKAICSECGLPYGELASHRFGAWVSEVPATCEEDGVKAHKYCSLCEKNYDEHGNVIVSLVISAKGHKLGNLVTKVEPTCVDGGMKAHYQCLTCSEYFDANKVKVDKLELVIPANGHNLTFNALVPATCENVGTLAHYHCSTCGKDYEDNEATTELASLVIEALGHSYGEWVPAKAATCEDAGNVGYFQCSECEKYFDINRNELTNVVIEALGHSYGTTLVGKDKIHHGYKCSTCGEFKDLENHTPGAEATEHTDQVCTVCNYILAPATNHINHVADETSWITNSTYHWHKCVGCDIVVESSKAEHDYTNNCDTTCNTCGYIREITHDYEAVITNPTCEESGYTTYTCEVCGDVNVDNYVNALGHVVVIDKAKAATCTDTGLSEGSHCDRCNSVLVAQIVVDSLGHDEVTHTAKAATCTEIGWGAYVTCNRCEYTTYQEIPALNHDLVSHEAKAATCTEIGWDAYITCSRCEYTTYQEIAKLGHEVVVDDAVLPGCEEPGKTAGSHCSRCNTVYVAQEEIAALGHDWKDATCTAPKTCNTCGKTEGVALGHNDEEVVDGPYSWQECSVCHTQGTKYVTVYLKPNSNWKKDNARFAVYCFGNGEKWFDMTDENSDGIYEAKLDATYSKIIYCRMNPNNSSNNWSNRWNQTADLDAPKTLDNLYAVKEGTWDKGGGTWNCTHQLSEMQFDDNNHYYMCTICNEKVNVEAHTNNATCTEGYKCLCGKEFAAKDHAFEYKYYNKAGDEITSGSEVSCTQDLVYRGTCSNDVNHVTEVFVKGKDLLDNDLGITVKHEHVSTATCVSDSVCTDCGFVMQEKTPSNHTYGAWIITQNPTSSSIGVAEKDCQYCDAKEVFVVPALTKANYYDENSTLPYEYHASTCNEKGVEIFRVIIGEQVIGEFKNELDKLDHSPEEDDNDCETPTLCEHCGEKLVDGKAHTYVDSVCSVCGKERTIKVSDLVSSDPTINQITKNSNGEQVITYGPREAAYYTVTSEVSYYTPNLNIFKFSYTANEEVQLCFSINGEIDWSSAGGHRMYPAGTHTIYLDVETYLAENATELPESFTVLIYLNATVAPENSKEITIHSLTFTDEMIISAPKASGLECVQGENGYDISYDNNESQWRNISIDVINYSSKYNVLRIILDVPMNTNIQISVDYLDVNGVEDSQTLRSHWGQAGVVEPAGEVVFEYDLSELVSIGNVITKVVIYFDNPTGYTTNTGVVSAKLILYEFVALKLCQHDLVKTDAKAATCDEHGNYEYWTCLLCDEIFALADATEKTTVERQKLLPLGHDLVKTDAKSSTCEEQGNNAYWTCEVCEKVFADEAGTQVTTVEAQKLPLDSHDLVKTDAKPSTCTENGNNAYWTCEVCEKVFADENATNETTVLEQTIPAGHSYTKKESSMETHAGGWNYYYTCANQGCTSTSDDTYEEYIIYYYNSLDWAKINLYNWGGSASSATWPGNQMNKVEGKDKWYYYKLDGAPDNIIFNNGSEKTSDIALESGKVYFYGKKTDGYATATEALEAYQASLVAPKEYLYLKPNSNWTQGGARFAAYFFGNGEKWVDMTDEDGDGVYECEKLDGYTKVIFCRMNPGSSTNNWDNKWNQTGDLTIPTDGKNLFTVPNGVWNGSTSGWSTYTPSA